VFVVGVSLNGFIETANANPVYVYRQADGTIRFSTSKPTGVNAKVFSASGSKFSVYKSGNNFAVWKDSKTLFKEKYDREIKDTARRYKVDPALVKAVIHAESRFNPDARSRRGAIGLMQLMPSTAKLLGVSDPRRVTDNIEGGVKYLAKLLKLFKGNLNHCIAAYNAGEGAVVRYGGVPPYRETRAYVQKVLSLFEQYRAVV
jgi:soluble lytic murein transglycosylase-like protein